MLKAAEEASFSDLRRRSLELRGGARLPHGCGDEGALVLAAAAADGDVAEGAAFGPVAAARLAEMARLREVVVVVVAKFCVGGIAAWAPQILGASTAAGGGGRRG